MLFVFYSFLIPLYPTFVQELDWELALAGKLVLVAMDIERISLQGRKWIPCLRTLSLSSSHSIPVLTNIKFFPLAV